MFFRKKLRRVLTDQQQAEERFRKEREELPLEKNDRLAMILAALVVFIPALIVVAAVFFLVLYVFFLRFL